MNVLYHAGDRGCCKHKYLVVYLQHNYLVVGIKMDTVYNTNEESQDSCMKATAHDRYYRRE